MSSESPPPVNQKEGLQTAIDFTKFLLTLAGGAIAFIIQPTFFVGSYWLKCLSVSALVLLSVCVISGLLVFSGGSVMLARGEYNLEERHIKIPGIINVISFGVGFVLLAAATAIRIIST